MNNFAFVRMHSGITNNANFQTFKLSFMILLRISTGENWGSLMSDFARKKMPNFFCVDIKTIEDYKEIGT